MKRKPRVLFLCTHNSARSQMAEAFLRRYGDEHFDAHSAGLEPTQIHPLTLHVMQEVGINLEIEGHRSKSLIDEYFTPKLHLGYLITVCRKAEANCPTLPGVSLREYWEIEDPAAFEGTEAERQDRFRRAERERCEPVRQDCLAACREYAARCPGPYYRDAQDVRIEPPGATGDEFCQSACGGLAPYLERAERFRADMNAKACGPQ